MRGTTLHASARYGLKSFKISFELGGGNSAEEKAAGVVGKSHILG